MTRRLMLFPMLLLASPVFAQTATTRSYAQALVDQVVAAHPEVVVMAMHVTPPKQKYNVIIASNIGRIGKRADADDMGVVNTGKTLVEVNKAGNRLEIEQVLEDVTGDNIGALSIVYHYKPGDDKAELVKRSEEIRDQLKRRISKRSNLTQPYKFDPGIPSDTYAQQLVDRSLATHPELLILAMHVVPPGGSTNEIVGSSIGRLGKKADADDLRAIRTGTPNLEVNGNRFEVETRLLDNKGETIGAVGIVFPYKPGDDKNALKRRGFAIRDELRARIPSVAALMEPAPSPIFGVPPLRLLGRSLDWQPGYSGDFDHFGVVARRHQLLLAAEDHGTLEVFNLASGAHQQTLTTFSTPHAFLYLPKPDRLIVTDSGKGGTRILDAANFKVIGHIKLAPGADSMAYDAPRHRLYIVSGGKDVGMKDCFLNEVDPVDGHVYRKLRFDADHVEAVAAEPHGQRLFVNVADKNEVAVVDKVSLKVIARWPIVGAKTNLTMALDAPDHRLFVGTRNPSRLYVINTDTGATVTSMDAPATSDGLFYDHALNRIYIPGGDGYLGVYKQLDPEHYVELGRVASALGAKSGIALPEHGRIYLAASPGEHGKGGSILWFSLH